MPAKIMLTAAAVLAVLAAAAQAAPNYDPDTRSVKVSIADLNLHNAAGARILLRRIRNAAQLICGDETASRFLDRRAMSSECVRTTVKKAVASQHIALLTAALDAGSRESTLELAENR